MPSNVATPSQFVPVQYDPTTGCLVVQGHESIGLVGLSVTASGDPTGATDTAAINAALAAVMTPYASLLAVGPTAAGNTVALVPGVYTINAPLRIGSFTTLDARGSVINMALGTNTNMLNNYGATAVANSLYPGGGGGTGAGASLIVMNNGASDPIVQKLLNVNSDSSGTVSPSWGATLIIPMTYTGNGFTNMAWSGTSGAQFCGNFFNINTFHQIQLETQGPTTPASMSNQSVYLYYRDVGITVLGGVWNHGTSGVGSNTGNGTDYLSHTMRFFCCDGLMVDGCTIISQGLNGLYAVSLCSVNGARMRNLSFDTNPEDWSWTNNHSAGYQRDGVHIVGPCRDIHISDLIGSTGDDIVSITPFDWYSSSLGVGGNITNVNVENIFAGYGQSSMLKVLGGPGLVCSHIRGRNLGGNATTGIYIGDDNRRSETAGGTIDDVVVDGVQMTGNNALGTAVSLVGPGLQRIKLRNINAAQYTGTTVNFIEVGLGASGSAQTTVIGDLALDGIQPETLISGNKVLHINSTTTVSMLRLKDWDAPLTNYALISNAGTVTAAMCPDVLNLVTLAGQTASIGSTGMFTPGLSGVYSFVVDLVTTTAGTGGTVTASIITNNGSAAVTQTTSTVSLGTLGTEGSTTFTAYCAATQSMNYSTTVAGATGSPQYALRVRMEFLG
jgi:hypothetical protein